MNFEADALTKVPISNGEEVVMVLPKYKPEQDVDDYFFCFSLTFAHPFGLLDKIEMIAVGVLEDGVIDGLDYEIKHEFDDRPDLRSIFFYKETWDFVIKRVKPLREFDNEWVRVSELKGGFLKHPNAIKTSGKELCEQYLKVIYFAYLNNINLGDAIKLKNYKNNPREIDFFDISELAKRQLHDFYGKNEDFFAYPNDSFDIFVKDEGSEGETQAQDAPTEPQDAT